MGGRLKIHDIDPKFAPAYNLAECARYIGVGNSTFRAWVRGRAGEFEPVMPTECQMLSFVELAEAHVVSLVRKGCGIPMRRLRKAIGYIVKEFGGDLTILASERFCHDQKNLFLRLEGKLLSLTEGGQFVAEPIIAQGLRQFVYGSDKLVAQFFPKVGAGRIVIDPKLNFGRPTLARTGHAAHAIAERNIAGEPIKFLAEDYGISEEDVIDAILWHGNKAA